MQAETDTIPRLFEIAAEQMGYFTSAQAVARGVSRRRLSHHAGRGTLIHIRRGLYRLRDYPSTPGEEIMAAWLTLGKECAVVSHESALDLLNLSDVTPNRIHLTVPRSRRHRPTMPGVVVHTTVRPFAPLDLDTREGIRITSPSRSILDAAQYGTGPEQIEMAIRQALGRGWIDYDRLLEQAQQYDKRVRRLVTTAADRAAA